MKYILSIFFASLLLSVNGQDNNYIRKEIINKKGITSESQINGLTILKGEKAEVYEYFDVIGKKSQTVSVQSSPSGYDIVTPVYYDEYQRNSRVYLPYPVQNNNGAYISNSISAQEAFYSTITGDIKSDSKAYSVAVYEKSPLNKVIKQYGVGSAWQDNNKGIETLVRYNSSHLDQLFNFKLNSGQLSIENYRDNELKAKMFLTALILGPVSS